MKKATTATTKKATTKKATTKKATTKKETTEAVAAPAADSAELQTIIAAAVAAAVADALAKRDATEAAAAPAAAPADATRAEEVRAHNDAILATIPTAKRAFVRAQLKRCNDAGFPYAKLQTNKKHQLDAIRILCMEAGKGSSEQFKNTPTKQGKTYSAKRAAALAARKPAPAEPSCCFYWGASHGGQLYARDVFFSRDDARAEATSKKARKGKK